MLINLEINSRINCFKFETIFRQCTQLRMPRAITCHIIGFKVTHEFRIYGTNRLLSAVNSLELEVLISTFSQFSEKKNRHTCARLSQRTFNSFPMTRNHFTFRWLRKLRHQWNVLVRQIAKVQTTASKFGFVGKKWRKHLSHSLPTKHIVRSLVCLKTLRFHQSYSPTPNKTWNNVCTFIVSNALPYCKITSDYFHYLAPDGMRIRIKELRCLFKVRDEILKCDISNGEITEIIAEIVIRASVVIPSFQFLTIPSNQNCLVTF